MTTCETKQQIQDANPATDHKTSQHQMPDVYNTIMNDGQLYQLFTDIEACTEVLGILVKPHPQQYIPAKTVDLDEAEQLLSSKQIRGIQIRYLYEGKEWWDTVMIEGEGYKVVRIAVDG